MKFEKINKLESEEFRRLTGIKRSTFKRMVEILIEEEIKKKARGGKPNKQCMEDRLLMALEYLREYRTYFHIAQSYGVSESACYRNIRWIEETLVKDPDFALPGRKELLKSEMGYEVLVIDATETAVERPKKSRGSFTQERRKSTL